VRVAAPWITCSGSIIAGGGSGGTGAPGGEVWAVTWGVFLPVAGAAGRGGDGGGGGIIMLDAGTGGVIDVSGGLSVSLLGGSAGAGGTAGRPDGTNGSAGSNGSCGVLSTSGTVVGTITPDCTR
jgi:hypothetical protein